MPLWAVAAVLVANIPFGYWRANVRKYSFQWILAIHIPVVLAIALRLVAAVPFEPATAGIMAGAFFLGQFVGQKSRDILSPLLPMPPSSCVFWDLFRATFS